MTRISLLLSALALLAACGGSGPSFVQAPEVAANPKVPQAAVLTFEADRPVSTRIAVSAGDREWALVLGDPNISDDLGWALFGSEHLADWP